ncbi:hypothetical protein [Burkholderia sp. FL-7-2-10-S1-D7]|uniref:hypothetical protein n=1 Tax=Burkholderia sp. FL-7-2-10-S1-D7 TaxID=1637866 RepID=UPI000A92E5BF|nr:hypothetical protein [Burkholderia sp. FL-7-2-10-S1-D7]
MSASSVPNPKKIFSKEFVYQDCLDVELLLQHTEMPEAYPLIYRQHQVERWRLVFPHGDLLALWIGCAIFIKNYVKNSMEASRSENFFTCIAFSMYEPNDEEVLIPKIYVANAERRDRIKSTFRKITSNKESANISKIKAAFVSCGMVNNFEFYEDGFDDPSGDGKIIWLYCIQSD